MSESVSGAPVSGPAASLVPLSGAIGPATVSASTGAVPRDGNRASARPMPLGPLEVMAHGATLAARNVRLATRELDALMTALFLPVMLMVTFVYLFGGAISTGTRYITYVVPGVLLLCAGVGSASTAVTVCRDMAGGIVDRFRSMDIGGLPIVAGHVVASVARNAASTVLVFAVALGIGFRPHASLAAWAGVAGMLLLYVLAVSWLCALAGMMLSSPEAANSLMFLPMIVTYASSAFVPIRTMPSWLHGFAHYQPATPVIETLRGLLLHTPVGMSGWQALAWCGGILLMSAGLSGLAFRKRTG